MKSRLLLILGLAAILGVSVLVVTWGPKEVPASASTDPSELTTSWGEPDLQGLWSDEYQIPLQRPAKYAGRELLTDAEVAAIDRERAAKPSFGEKRGEKGTERDVAGAYNSEIFLTRRHTGRRTSLIVDPPDGRIPPLTPEVLKRRQEIREWQLALLQATDSCKFKWRGCEGGTYTGVGSPRRDDAFKYYPLGSINRMDNPEDHGLGFRCMSGILPDFGGVTGNVRGIVQSPRAVSIFYDTGQGQGWHRTIPVDGSPHLPPSVRLWWGDSRGRWEGDTLVVDVTNFSPRTDYQGSRQNLHLTERFTRLDRETLEYQVTMDDPTTWARPWTVKQEYTLQSAEHNRVYKEPRCHEGNHGLIGALAGARLKDRLYKEGHGPDPRTINTTTATNSALDAEDLDEFAE
jgi:hypothetical protein